MSKNDFHIGNLILQKLKEKERSVAWLATKLPCEKSGLYKILKRPHIENGLLTMISEILEYDFFIHYSNNLHLNNSKEQDQTQ